MGWIRLGLVCGIRLVRFSRLGLVHLGLASLVRFSRLGLVRGLGLVG